VEKSTKKDNILPLRKSDPFCHTSSAAGNTIFMLYALLNYEETEGETLKGIIDALSEYFESYQENDLVAEMIYREFIKIAALIDAFQSEATICPKCKSLNVVVTETDDETENQCLDCQSFFTSD